MSLESKITNLAEFLAHVDKLMSQKIDEIEATLALAGTLAGNIGGTVDWDSATNTDLSEEITSTTSGDLTSYTATGTAQSDGACQVHIVTPAALTSSLFSFDCGLSVEVNDSPQIAQLLHLGDNRVMLFNIRAHDIIKATVKYPSTVSTPPSIFEVVFYQFSASSWDDSNFNPTSLFTTAIL